MYIKIEVNSPIKYFYKYVEYKLLNKSIIVIERLFCKNNSYIFIKAICREKLL